MANIFKQKPAVKGGIMHCFSGRYSDAVWALDNGLLIGINGIIGYKKNEDLRQSVKKIGAKYLVVETDCPYLPPQSKRGQRNDPSNIPEIAATTADILGISISSLADITTQNTRDLFKF
jgi:TatD DNase family protein